MEKGASVVKFDTKGGIDPPVDRVKGEYFPPLFNRIWRIHFAVVHAGFSVDIIGHSKVN